MLVGGVTAGREDQVPYYRSFSPPLPQENIRSSTTIASLLANWDGAPGVPLQSSLPKDNSIFLSSLSSRCDTLEVFLLSHWHGAPDGGPVWSFLCLISHHLFFVWYEFRIQAFKNSPALNCTHLKYGYSTNPCSILLLYWCETALIVKLPANMLKAMVLFLLSRASLNVADLINALIHACLHFYFPGQDFFSFYRSEHLSKRAYLWFLVIESCSIPCVVNWRWELNLKHYSLLRLDFSSLQFKDLETFSCSTLHIVAFYCLP